MDIATLDFDRYRRRGYPEAVFCMGKTLAQVHAIARAWRQKSEQTDQELGTVLFTRATPEQLTAIRDELPGVFIDDTASLAAWPGEPPAPSGGRVVVVCAGTSDLPVAREAALTARYLGREVTEVVDVGVAGLTRVIARLDELREADVIVLAAGMDAALVPVVAGLVACPVVAVPTSVGYGAAFEGVAALLSMLNSCAPGVGVVNIDNGYGAGHLAAQIAAPGRHHA
ncbi:nickel pincer cofactor biosynthesis protein LarB [Tessaracoccus sp. ZS01]|uniref:nickel pincer cofactor biosynthesis protein LarB n=1 Tax=Tessaracoccus sp. ZS01 TaxID=1906324 RepID=UPI00096CF33F|nr:nickel pincer cofactor biosynthesis protein LarB [Tessaracoccus sp. ZS01]MCG6567467.1 AIR carboxylase family protein [Tessaracoccus sp. ZS01]OMG57031.1 1-(5-phosphoribosyl)-5-amino-4-imidazole-carboxylate carboxylase [Tessaracoccus sp. ZS01]